MAALLTVLRVDENYSCHFIDGLQAILFSLDIRYKATFCFETAETAAEAAKGVQNAMIETIQEQIQKLSKSMNYFSPEVIILKV